MSKPSVNTRAVADHYSSADEKIIEVSNGLRSAETHKGALISLRNMPDDTLRISVYRADPGVAISVAGPSNGTRFTMLTDGTGISVFEARDADGVRWFRALNGDDGALVVEMNDKGEFAFSSRCGVKLADRRMLLAYLAGLHGIAARALGVRVNRTGQL